MIGFCEPAPRNPHMQTKLSRRNWLTLAAASALPWFRRPANAQSTTPRKIVFFYTPHGAPAEFFFPTAGTTDSMILEPLNAHQADVSVLRGIDYIGSSNHPAIHHILTNHLPRSLDHVIADTVSADRFVPSVHLGVIPDYTRSFTVDGQWSYAPEPVPHDPDPVAVYERLLAGTTSSADATEVGTDTSAQARNLIGKFTLAEVAQLQARLGALPGERAKLDVHRDSLENLLSRASAPKPTAAGPLAAVEAARGLDVWDQNNFPALLDAQIDVAAAVLARGVTRAVNLQLMYTNAQIPLPIIGLNQGHHDLSHSSPGTDGRRMHAEAQRWFATKFGELITKLKVPDPDNPSETLLDNTAVVWCSEVGDGQEHTCTNIPLVIAGSAGGFLKMGQTLDFGSRSHASLLLTLCRAMGAPETDVGANSEQGPLAELEV